LLAGVAGADLNKVFHPQPQWSAYRTAHHGYGLLRVQSAKKLRFCYHRERDGKMWDAFTITKPNNSAKKEISYDYENKWLQNWVTLPQNEKRRIKKEAKLRARGYPGQCLMDGDAEFFDSTYTASSCSSGDEAEFDLDFGKT